MREIADAVGAAREADDAATELRSSDRLTESDLSSELVGPARLESLEAGSQTGGLRGMRTGSRGLPTPSRRLPRPRRL